MNCVWRSPFHLSEVIQHHKATAGGSIYFGSLVLPWENGHQMNDSCRHSGSIWTFQEFQDGPHITRTLGRNEGRLPVYQNWATPAN